MPLRVLVTGGAGFVGSHTVAALVRAGHEVRVLSRLAADVAPALRPLGVDAGVEAFAGDTAVPGAVEAAMRGCDAVVHCAAVRSLSPRDAEQLRRTSVSETGVVLNAAYRLGLDPIVHISSIAAVLPSPDRPVTPETPVGPPPGACAPSLAESELIARELQARGAPVVISRLGPPLGPGDPDFGDTSRLIRCLAGGPVLFAFAGGVRVVDVRDAAAAHAALMQPGLGPRRYLLTGPRLSIDAADRLIRELTGRRRPRITLPAEWVPGLGRAADAIARVAPVRPPLGHAMARLLSLDSRVDPSRARRELGFEPRLLRDTLADTILWMAESGKIRRGVAGRLLRPDRAAGARLPRIPHLPWQAVRDRAAGLPDAAARAAQRALRARQAMAAAPGRARSRARGMFRQRRISVTVNTHAVARFDEAVRRTADANGVCNWILGLRDVGPLPADGYREGARLAARHRLAGFDHAVVCEVLALDPSGHAVRCVAGPVAFQGVLALEPAPEGVRVSGTLEILPRMWIALPFALAGPIIRVMLRRRLRRRLAFLKAALETDRAEPAGGPTQQETG